MWESSQFLLSFVFGLLAAFGLQSGSNRHGLQTVSSISGSCRHMKRRLIFFSRLGKSVKSSVLGGFGFPPHSVFSSSKLGGNSQTHCSWSIVRLKFPILEKKKLFLKCMASLNKVRPSLVLMCFLCRRWKRRCLQRRFWQWQHPGYSRRVPREQRNQCYRLQEVPDGPLGSQGNHSNWS